MAHSLVLAINRQLLWHGMAGVPDPAADGARLTDRKPAFGGVTGC